MEWTRKHQNLTSASDNAVFRSSLNKDKQDLPFRQKSNANEGCNSAMKRKNVVSIVMGLKKQARKYRRNSDLNGSEIPADVSVKHPNKRLPACWIKVKVMLAAMKMKPEQPRRNQGQKYFNTQSTTSSSETMWATKSKTWTEHLVPKLLSVELLWGPISFVVGKILWV